MSRVHQLAALGRSELIGRYLQLYPHATPYQRQAAARNWSVERLIDLIVEAETRGGEHS